MAAPMSQDGFRLCRSCFSNFSWFLAKKYTQYLPSRTHKLFIENYTQSMTWQYAVNKIRLDNVRCRSTTMCRINDIRNDRSLCSPLRQEYSMGSNISLSPSIRIPRCSFSWSSAISAQHDRTRSVHGSSHQKCSRKEENTPRSKEFIAKQRKIRAALKSKVADISEDIKTIPNLLTLLRMLSAPVLGSLIVYEQFSWAVGLFIASGITDLMDGYIARNFKNQKSVLGSFIDPLADKLLVTVLAVTLTMVELIPVPLVVLIIGRDVGLIGAAFYIRYLSLPLPKTFSRYFDLTLPTAKLYPSTLSKVNTGLQLSLVALTLAAPVFDYVNHPGLQALWYITAITTFSSGLQYVLSAKSFFKILQEKSDSDGGPHHRRKI